MWAVDSYNGNSWNRTHGVMHSSSADAFLMQETKLTEGKSTRRAEELAASRKWKMASSPAGVTHAGATSAGVAIAVRAHHGLAGENSGTKKRATEDVVDDCPSRFDMKWWGAYCRGGIHLGSAYLWVNEGASRRNLDLLQMMARRIEAVKGPWIIAGDFNMSPGELAQTGWLGLVGGIVISPGRPTCGANTLDYFVVSEGLAPAIAGVSIIDDVARKPHALIRLYLKPFPRSMKVRKMRRLAKIGPTLPHGPAQPAINLDDNGDERCRSSDLDLEQMVNSWMRKVETETASLSGEAEHEWAKKCGRDRGPRMCWQPAVGPVAEPHEFVSRASSRWNKAAAWCRDVLAHRRRVEAGVRMLPTTGGSGAVATAATRKLQRLASRQPRAGADTHAVELYRWAHVAVTAISTGHKDVLQELMVTAQAAADKAERSSNIASRERWRKWLCDDPHKAVARQHRYSKVPNGWLPSRVASTVGGIVNNQEIAARQAKWDAIRVLEPGEDGSIQPLNAQQAVEAEADDWAAHWLADGPSPELLWPDEMLDRSRL